MYYLGNPDTAYQIFLATIVDETYDIYDSLEFESEGNKIKLDIVIKNCKEIFVGETHKAYETGKLHFWKQKASESKKSYFAALR